jgi:hypothetical protein
MRQKNNVLKDIIDKMFIIAGHSVGYDDIINRKDNWYMQWSMTDDQRKDWINWGIEYIRKKKRYSKHLAEREMRMIDLYCGLTDKTI